MKLAQPRPLRFPQPFPRPNPHFDRPVRRRRWAPRPAQLLSHGASVTNTSAGTVTTVTGTLTLTAGNSIVVEAFGEQTGGGTRTLSCASDKDGSLGTPDSDTGAAAVPSCVWHLNTVTGGSTVITVTASGSPSSSMRCLLILVREYAGGALTLANAIQTTQALGTLWDSTAVLTGQTTVLLCGFACTAQRNDFNTGSTAGDDGNSNNYTLDLGATEATNGESCQSEDFMGSLASASRKATMTVPNAAGTMHFVAYYIAGGGPAALYDPMRMNPYYNNPLARM